MWNILRVHFLKWLCICFRVHINNLTCGAFQDSNRASRVSRNYCCQDPPVFGYDPLPFPGPNLKCSAPCSMLQLSSSEFHLLCRCSVPGPEQPSSIHLLQMLSSLEKHPALGQMPSRQTRKPSGPTPELHSSLSPSQHHISPQRWKSNLPIFKTQMPGVMTDRHEILAECVPIRNCA